MFKKGTFLEALIACFSVNIVIQIIGLLRQVLIAMYFGVTRELDIYFMTYTIAMMVVFTFGTIFDTVGIPHLVRTREEDREESFRKLTGSIFTFSLLLTFLLSIIFIVFLPYLAKLVAAGFSMEDKKELQTMGFYFLPWLLIYLPYYALSSFYKSIRNFNIIFIAETIVSSVSFLTLFIYHPRTNALPITFFAGYFFGFLILFILSFKYFHRIGKIFSDNMKKVYKNFFELFGVNQIGSLTSIVERFFQSFLASGSISALSYASTLTTQMSSFFSFREIFIVPLSSGDKEDKKDKLERVVIGLSVLIIPIMIFVAYYSEEILAILFKRGKFDANALTMTSSALSIYALSLLPAIAGTPVFRMFQVIDRIKNTGFIYLLGAVNFIIFGAIFIFYLKLGIVGMASTVAINSYVSSCFSIYLLHKNGITLNFFRVMKYIAYAILVAIAGIILLNFILPLSAYLLLNLTIKGVVYIIFTILAYMPLKQKLLKIVYK